MILTRYARRKYTPGPTPLEFAPNLTRALGGPEVWLKRDDLTGLAAGGNKTRKLEFLVADALAQGCDTLITTGAPQSNHCRLTAAAAAREGLKCRLVIEERTPKSYDPKAGGNNFLFDLLGVEQIKSIAPGADVAAALQAEADALKAAKRKGYIIPGGGSNGLGALGYAACVQELMGQLFDAQIDVQDIVCASGSGGTQAGILAGLTAVNAPIPVTGICVSRPRLEQEGVDAAPGPQTARTSWTSCRLRTATSSASTTGWGPATPSRRRKWSKPSAWWRASKACCSIRSTPARPWPV